VGQGQAVRDASPMRDTGENRVGPWGEGARGSGGRAPPAAGHTRGCTPAPCCEVGGLSCGTGGEEADKFEDGGARVLEEAREWAKGGFLVIHLCVNEEKIMEPFCLWPLTLGRFGTFYVWQGIVCHGPGLGPRHLHHTVPQATWALWTVTRLLSRSQLGTSDSCFCRMICRSMTARSKLRGQKGKLRLPFVHFAPVESFLVAKVSMGSVGVAETSIGWSRRSHLGMAVRPGQGAS